MAVGRPVARFVGDEIEGAHPADGDVDRDIVPRRHMMLVSVRLDDGSWVTFSSSALGASPSLDWSLTAIMICFAVAIVVVALLLLRWATRPLCDLALAAERFSLDPAPQPPPENGPAEVRRAARAFNRMRERIQRLVTERMQAMAAVSHDLRTPITEADDHFIIAIENEGPGVPPAHMERVFHPFVRLEESRGRATGGSRLGLTIAQAVVRSHGGGIALENQSERGLRVTVSLPGLLPSN